MGNCTGPPRTEEVIKSKSRNDKLDHKRSSQETNDNNNNNCRSSFNSFAKIVKTSNTSLQLILCPIIEEFPLPIYLRRDEKVTLIVSGKWSFLSEKDLCDFRGHPNTEYNNYKIGALLCRVQGGITVPINNNKSEYISDSNGQMMIWGNSDQTSVPTYGNLEIKIEGTPQLSPNQLNIALGWSLKIQIESKPDYMTEDEFEIYNLINKLRVDPQIFATQYLDKENEPNHTHFKETFEMLTTYTSVPPLDISEPLYKAAKDHSEDIGIAGITGHISTVGGYYINERIKKHMKKEIKYFGENCCYGKRIPLSIVLDMIVDFGLRVKNNRLNLLNGNFDHIGISISKHFSFKWNAAIAFNAENKTLDHDNLIGKNESSIKENSNIESHAQPNEEFKYFKEQKPPVILQEIPIQFPREPGFMNGGILNIFGNFFGPKIVSDEDCFKIFAPLKLSTKTYKNFTLYCRSRPGVLIIYSKAVLEKMTQLVEQIKKDHFALELIHKSEVYPMLVNSEEGKILARQLDVKVFPSVFICKSLKKNTMLGILGRLEREIDLASLMQLIMEGTDTYYRLNQISQPQQQSQQSHHPINNPNIIMPQPIINDNQHIFNNPSQNINSMTDDELAKFIQSQEYNQGQGIYSPSQFFSMSNGDLIQQQKRDLEELERKEQAKKYEERRLEEERKNELKRQEELKQKEIIEKRLIEEQLNKKKSELPPEPEESDPNKTKILFRYPDGERNKERKFLKTNTIKVLYDFIDSLGRDIYIEPEVTQYELIQTFPFKRYENKAKTLEQEGLFPNAVIQIREIEKS